jgi:PBP1b-binding outer membrane lipoprotein LpoB
MTVASAPRAPSRGVVAPIALALLALLLSGCSAAQYSPETCRQERQRSKQVSRSSFCEAAGTWIDETKEHLA